MNHKKEILKNLATLYQQALTQDNFPLALKIIELQARIEGYLMPAKLKNISVANLSNADLDQMIQELEMT